MSLALLFHYLMLNIFRMLIHPSSGACDLFVELLHGLYCSCSVYVGVTLWFGWVGVVSVYRLKHFSASACTVIKSSQLITYKAKAAVCSEIRTKHSTQSEHHVELLYVKPGGT